MNKQYDELKKLSNERHAMIDNYEKTHSPFVLGMVLAIVEELSKLIRKMNSK
jgi:hypothetical protein